MKNIPIVTAEEMKRIEQLAFAAGESDQTYMENAGAGIAAVLQKYLLAPIKEKELYLLIGKGNNGGDAFAAGTLLANKGYTVIAFLLHPLEECSPLSQTMGHRLKKARGKLQVITSPPDFGPKGIIVDGLTGTGFQGAAKGLLAEVIEEANTSSLPVFSVDIPSGLNGSTGEVETVAIKADITLYLGLPKIGFFINKGWNHVGELLPVDFGLPDKFLEKVEETARLMSKQRIAKELPPIKRTRHKYEAGYVLAMAGSPGMSGAALLSSYSALKTGAGIVRLFYPYPMKEELASAPFELITEGWDLKNDVRITEESKRAKALIVGPGIGRTEETHAAVKTLLRKTLLPTVIDADALYFLAKDPELPLPEKTILTPHSQEMERILKEAPTFSVCQDFVKQRKVTLVLKGAPTIVFHPHTRPLIIPYGDPGMATAGTGDVLTGVIASMFAQGLSPRSAAALGVSIHSLAGEIAAKRKSSYGMTAIDLLHCLPDAILSLLEHTNSNP